jgi:enamine deaminase RidA (YjgF/YER057c/UK114 family)
VCLPWSHCWVCASLDHTAGCVVHLSRPCVTWGMRQVTAYVNCATDFEQHPQVRESKFCCVCSGGCCARPDCGDGGGGDGWQVVNGYSDLLLQVWGEAGKCARAAVGVGSLPFNVPVEVAAVFQLRL